MERRESVDSLHFLMELSMVQEAGKGADSSCPFYESTNARNLSLQDNPFLPLSPSRHLFLAYLSMRSFYQTPCIVPFFSIDDELFCSLSFLLFFGLMGLGLLSLTCKPQLSLLPRPE